MVLLWGFCVDSAYGTNILLRPEVVTGHTRKCIETWCVTLWLQRSFELLEFSCSLACDAFLAMGTKDAVSLEYKRV